MSLKKNVIANYLGNGWSVLMSLAFLPLYIRYLGIEAYGLIGVFMTAQALLYVVEAGLTPTLGREIARYLGGANTSQEIKDLLKSFEYIFVSFAAVLIIITTTSASWFALNWLKIENLPPQKVSVAISIMGFVISLRWVIGLYRGAINGIQQQVKLNIIIAVFATIRGAGVILILRFVSPTIQAFFIFHLIISMIEALVLRRYLYQLLPDEIGVFSLAALKKIRKFSSGMILITILSVILTQADKVILSSLISLKDFGYYALAASIAGGLRFFIQPISNTVRPKFAELVALGDTDRLSQTYHKFSQLITIMVVPLSFTIIAFSDHAILLWTRNSEITEVASPIVSLLMFGTVINGMMNVPYALQLAYGKTHFAILANIIAILILIPTMFYAVSNYGMKGAAFIWVTLNLGYMLFSMPYMHKYLLKGHLTRWYIQDIIQPSFLGVLVITVFYFISNVPLATKPLYSVWIILISFFSAIFLSVCSVKYFRDQLFITISISLNRSFNFFKGIR